MEYCDTT
jgi:hypothetical protein